MPTRVPACLRGQAARERERARQASHRLWPFSSPPDRRTGAAVVLTCTSHCDCLADSSLGSTGLSTNWLQYCTTMRAMGRDRYAAASSHPIGGTPSTNGKSHAVPDPARCAARDVGPDRDGIQ